MGPRSSPPGIASHHRIRHPLHDLPAHRRRLRARLLAPQRAIVRGPLLRGRLPQHAPVGRLQRLRLRLVQRLRRRVISPAPCPAPAGSPPPRVLRFRIRAVEGVRPVPRFAEVVPRLSGLVYGLGMSGQVLGLHDSSLHFKQQPCMLTFPVPWYPAVLQRCFQHHLIECRVYGPVPWVLAALPLCLRYSTNFWISSNVYSGGYPEWNASSSLVTVARLSTVPSVVRRN